jgi:hypothetical protein
MINFRELVVEALNGVDNNSLPTHAASIAKKEGFFDIISSIKNKCTLFNDSEVKKASFYSAAWTLAGQKQFYPTSVSRNPIFYDTCPMLDFLFLIKEQYAQGGLKGKLNWTSDLYKIGGAVKDKDYGLTQLEKDFEAHLTKIGPFTDPLFNYKPASATLSGVYQKIKDDILGNGVVGTKTFNNCIKNGYTIKQTIYLAAQLRQRNTPLIASIPTTNKSIDDFLLGCVSEEHSHLGGAVTPGIGSKIKSKIASAVSGIFKPKSIPTQLRGMEDDVISFMQAFSAYVAEKHPSKTTPPTPPTPDLIMKEISNKTARDFKEPITDAEKDVAGKLKNMLNHVPGEKDWVGKLRATASGLKSVESALGIKM